MTASSLLKRYFLFVVSLFLIGLGIAFTKHAELGISPVSSVANVISLKFPFLTFGSWLILSNLFFLSGQILLLRRKFKTVQLLQIPLSFLFGCFTDLGLWFAKFFCNDTYLLQLLLVVIGNFILALGIALSVTADVLLNPPEGFVKALSDTLRKKFSSVKTVFDICWVLISILLSVLLFNGALVGVGEGTIISAILVGFFVKILSSPLQNCCKKIL